MRIEKMLNVTFVLCQHMLATSLTLPTEQLRAAEDLARAALPVKERRTPLLNIKLVSVDGAPVTTHTGITLAADGRFDNITAADIIYLPALWRNPNPVIQANRDLLPWLQTLYQNGSVLAGVGTGCYFIAETGLLDGKPATTHWHYFDHFQKRYPKVQLKRQYFITQAGNLYCTGSVNSLADLTIHFIQRYFSATIAAHVERHFFHEIRRAYENSRSLKDVNTAHPDEDIIQTQLWMQSHFSREFRMQDLARQFDMSMRTFNRRFKNATGVTPLAYLQKLRIETARELLQTSNLSVNEIMYKVGYQDSAHFTELFKKTHGTTPSQYRTTVRAKLFSLGS